MAINNCPVCNQAPTVYRYNGGICISCCGTESEVETHNADGDVVGYTHAISAIGTDESEVIAAWNNKGVN